MIGNIGMILLVDQFYLLHERTKLVVTRKKNKLFVNSSRRTSQGSLLGLLLRVSMWAFVKGISSSN